ncbi:MAG: glycosyltransferase family 2 protein [Candidatus Gracilibacteria bacterium]
MINKKLISFVLPVYNEEKNIPYVYADLLEVLSRVSENYEYEIIFVNDGSRDKSWEIIHQIGLQDKKVKGLNLSRNFGKELALSAGIDAAGGDSVITMDADGQHPVENIHDFLRFWEEGYEIVYNIRPENKGASWIKKLSSVLFYKIFNSFSEFKLEPGATDFRLLDRIVVDAYKQCGEKNRMYRGLIDWLGFKRKGVVFSSTKRLTGEASYNYRRLLKLAVNNLTSFSFFPLKFVGFIGVLITCSSSILLVFQALDKIGVIHMQFSNLGIVIVINTMMMGIVMISLGLLGLYIANINEESIHRPIYIVREKIN